MPFILSKMRLENFRDLGGIVNKDGHTIRSGLIFRSASMEHLCLCDRRELVKKYHLKHVIDLRTNIEISQKKDKIIKGVTYHHLPPRPRPCALAILPRPRPLPLLLFCWPWPWPA